MKERLLTSGASAVDTANTWGEAIAMLPSDYSTVVVEAAFADGTNSMTLVNAAMKLATPPVVVVMSATADPRLVADLILAGAEAYVEKPLDWPQLVVTLNELHDEVHLCRSLARRLVGRVGLKEAQWYLRGLMNREALSRAGGSQRAAADILRVDRRYVARLAHEFRGSLFAPESG